MANVLLIPVSRALRKLGNDLKRARRRRRLATQVIAERAGISRVTLNKIEKGDPGVSMANYATVLFVLGLLDQLSEVADITKDRLAQDLEEDFLPKRIHRKKPPKESD